MYARLPESVRQAARQASARSSQNPSHPGLYFKPLRCSPGGWSVRINVSYRAVGARRGDLIEWHWIGSHADFDRDFR